MTELRAKHANSSEGLYWGIDGNTGKIADMRESNVWDPVSVKLQTLKTSIEASCMLLRIDDIVSGIKRDKRGAQGGRGADEGDQEETFGDQRDG